MKKIFQNLTLLIMLSSTYLFISSCTTNQEVSEHQEQAAYQCPMDCEAGKTYKEPGACAVCGMPIELVQEK